MILGIRSISIGLAWLWIMLFWASISYAQTSKSPENQSTSSLAADNPNIEKFKDWEVICQEDKQKDKTATNPQKRCKMVQNHQVEGSGKTVFLLTILLTKDKKQPVGIISVPLGVYLIPGVLIKVDKRKPVRVLFEACNETGCHAGFPLKSPILNAFKRGLVAKTTLMDTKNKQVDIDVSLSGFTAAYKRLQEVSS